MEGKRGEFWPLELPGVCNTKGQQNGFLISLEMASPSPPPFLFLLTTIDAYVSERKYWWHLICAVKKKRQKRTEDRRMRQERQHWNTESTGPFYTRSWFPSWSQIAKYQRGHGKAFLRSWAKLGTGIRSIESWWRSNVVWEAEWAQSRCSFLVSECVTFSGIIFSEPSVEGGGGDLMVPAWMEDCIDYNTCKVPST